MYAWVYLAAILLGILTGLSDVHFLQAVGILISDIFIKIFKCISMPIVFLSIVVALSGYSAEASMRKIAQRTLCYTIVTTLIAASISCVLYLLIQPQNASVPAATKNVAMVVGSESVSYLEHLVRLMPNNLLSPFLENQVIPVLLMGVFIGFATRCIPQDEIKNTTVLFFKGMQGIFLVITGWIVRVIPLGLYGFITVTAIQFKRGMDFKGVGQYLGVIVLSNLIQGFIVLPLWLQTHRIKPFKAMRGMLPALTVAFFSKSSAGTLPVTMATAEKNLNIHPMIARFVLPFCTSMNMNGCAAFIFTTVIYLMQNHGLETTLPTMLLWIVIATIAAVGNAGVPMGCFFLSASLLASMNVPIVLMGVILPFYSVIDMVETALNVWSDACVAKVVNEKSAILS